MANFDTNTWYQLNFGDGTSQSMVGTALFRNGRTGAVFFTATNASDPQQLWQLFPYNSTYYVLRTKESGPYGYMGAKVGNQESTPGSTIPYMANATITDDSALWAITPWGDGTFYFTNAANGTDWHLQVKDNSLMAMSSNITAPQTSQSFSFNKLRHINDTSYSSISLAFASSTSTPTSAATNNPTPNPSEPAPTSSASGSGLSTGAKAGIGAAVAAVALIALIGLGFWFLRRRRRRMSQAPHQIAYSSSHERKSMIPLDVSQELASFSDARGYGGNTPEPPQELDHTGVAMHEMEGGKDKERRGRSFSPYKPGFGNEQKAVMPRGLFRENVALEMDAQQHSVERAELPVDEQRG